MSVSNFIVTFLSDMSHMNHQMLNFIVLLCCV